MHKDIQVGQGEEYTLGTFAECGLIRSRRRSFHHGAKRSTGHHRLCCRQQHWAERDQIGLTVDDPIRDEVRGVCRNARIGQAVSCASAEADGVEQVPRQNEGDRAKPEADCADHEAGHGTMAQVP